MLVSLHFGRPKLYHAPLPKLPHVSSLTTFFMPELRFFIHRLIYANLLIAIVPPP